MKFSTANEAIYAYHRLELSLSRPRAQTIGERARVPVPDCAKCGHGKSQTSISKSKGERTTSARCGAVWKFVNIVEGIGGARRAGPPRSNELDAYAELGRCLSKLPVWHRRTLMLFATWPAPGRRANGVAAYCAATWPRRSGGWSTRIVHELVDGPPGRPRLGARARLEAALARAELLDLEGRALRRAMGE